MNAITASDTTQAEAELARQQVRPGFSLPAYYYQDATRFAGDMNVMKETSWLLAGHSSQIPKAGDYFLFEMDQESIIIVRGKDGAINAFYNVCRHRGSRVCLEQQGSAKMLVCPYHAWSYDTSGKLIGAPDMPDFFNKSDYGLKKCHIGVVNGIIFVNLSTGTPPSFEEFTARLVPFLTPYQVEKTKVIARETVACPANWKLVVENFVECYHCGPSHKEYVKVHRQDSMLSYTDDTGGEGDWVQKTRDLGLYREPFFDGADNAAFQAGILLQIGGTALSSGKGGKATAPRLGTLKDWSGSWAAACFSPMCQVGCYEDHIIMFSFIPRGPLLTDCTMTWMVREDAVEGKDYNVDDVAYMWRHTFAEDKTICTNNQRGVSSQAYEPGPYSNTETRAVEVVDWYLRHYVDAQ